MEKVEFRDATREDAPFLKRMAARFGRGEDRPYFENFGVFTDYGVIALIDGEPVGAAWYRRAFAPRVDDVDFGPPPPVSLRETLLGVDKDFERRGYGSLLLDRLIEHARVDRGVEVLVGRPANTIAQRMIETRGFKFGSGGAHSLWVGGTSSAPQPARSQ